MKRKRGLFDIAASRTATSAQNATSFARQPLGEDEFGDVNEAAAVIQMMRSSFCGIVPRLPTLAQQIIDGKGGPAANSFETIAPVAVMTVAQVRGALGSLSAYTVDAELLQLMSLDTPSGNRIRLCRSPTDMCVVMSKDLEDYLGQLRKKLVDAPVKTSSTSSSKPGIAAVDFAHYLVRTTQERSITHSAVTGLYQQWINAGCPTCELRLDGSVSGSSRAALTPALSEVVAYLLRLGFLTRRTEAAPRATLVNGPSSSQSMSSGGSTIPTAAGRAGALDSDDDDAAAGASSRNVKRPRHIAPSSASSGPAAVPLALAHSNEEYWFGVPESGKLWQYLAAGRSELLTRVKQRRYGEIARSEAESLKLSRSPLDAKFVVRDAIGSGALEVVRTATGEFLRAPSG